MCHNRTENIYMKEKADSSGPPKPEKTVPLTDPSGLVHDWRQAV
jgi:hypothetical protein